jgi:hypothetical protein
MSRVGEQYVTRVGRKATIVEYTNAYKVLVEFEDGVKKSCEMGNLKKGNVAHPSDSTIPVVGSRWQSKAYGWCTVTEYINAGNITVEFDAPYKFKLRTENRSVRSGELKNPLQPDDKGFFFGEGKFDSHNKSYLLWNHMKKRCGNKNGRSPAYSDVSVCDSWKNYQNYASWHVKQIGYDQEGWHVDKDLLDRDARVYSPDTCVILPAHVNTMLTKRKAERGSTPIGTTIDVRDGKISCQYTENNIHFFRGYFPTVEEAFAVYKVAKEIHIKNLAEKWKDLLDPRAYQALMSYEVLITD